METWKPIKYYYQDAYFKYEILVWEWGKKAKKKNKEEKKKKNFS